MIDALGREIQINDKVIHSRFDSGRIRFGVVKKLTAKRVSVIPTRTKDFQYTSDRYADSVDPSRLIVVNALVP